MGRHEGWLWRGWTRFNKGDRDNALADFEETLRRNPSEAEAYAGRATIRKDRSDIAGAIEDYTKAMELLPQSSSRRSEIEGELREAQ
ncbi:MAG: tetratricopeptide repeat protein [Planctomycetes bacterium]|nr:tetratricopeptide repeat protein [Planctomycetota bacterium]